MAQPINNQSSTDYQIHTDTQSKYITSTMYALCTIKFLISEYQSISSS